MIESLAFMLGLGFTDCPLNVGTSVKKVDPIEMACSVTYHQEKTTPFLFLGIEIGARNTECSIMVICSREAPDPKPEEK